MTFHFDQAALGSRFWETQVPQMKSWRTRFLDPMISTPWRYGVYASLRATARPLLKSLSLPAPNEALSALRVG
jgi:hypothetical protein